jgi:phage-related baseplate assembly protein
MTTLLRPVFVATDPAAILEEMLADYQTAVGRILLPAQVERLILDVLAYRESLVRNAIQLTGEQNLVAFAVGTYLDALAANWGVTRWADKPSTCTIRFSLAVVQGTDVIIPAGTRVRSEDTAFTWATNAEATILAGQLYADVPATCSLAGEASNGYTAGLVKLLLDAVAGVTSVANLATTEGGVDIESDDHLRTRVQLAPYRASAGSEGAYRFHALNAAPEILDAVVTRPAPGEVQVAILTLGGAPTAGQIDQVEAAVTASDVRAICDTVTVVGTTSQPYQIEAELVLYETADPASVLAAAEAAAQAFATSRRRRLGLDATTGQVQAALWLPGVYDITLLQPAADVVVGDDTWADCTAISISVSGTAHG